MALDLNGIAAKIKKDKEPLSVAEKQLYQGFLISVANKFARNQELTSNELILYNKGLRDIIEDLKSSKPLSEFSQRLYNTAKARSPFPERVLYPGKKDTSGAQEKAPGSGKYWDNELKKFFYIKKSLKHPEDDIAEVYSSIMSRTLVGNHAAECSFIRNTSNQEMYIASEMYEGFEPLYSHRRDYRIKKMSDFNRGFRLTDFTSPDPVHSDSLIFGDMIKRGHPLTDVIHGMDGIQMEELCSVLSSSLLYRGYDVQTENLNFYTENEEKHVGRIDFGWALNDIASEPKVALLASRKLSEIMSKRGTKPTNHYREYLIFDAVQEALPAELEKVALDSQNNIDQLITDMEDCIENVGKCAVAGKEKINKAEALYNLAKHMGVKEWTHPTLQALLPEPLLANKFNLAEIDESSLTILQDEVHSVLKNSIISRAQQMDCIAQYMKYQNAIRGKPYLAQKQGIVLLENLLNNDNFKETGCKFADFDKVSGSDYPELVLNKKFIMDLVDKYKSMPSSRQETLKKFIANFCTNSTIISELQSEHHDLYNEVLLLRQQIDSVVEVGSLIEMNSEVEDNTIEYITYMLDQMKTGSPPIFTEGSDDAYFQNYIEDIMSINEYDGSEVDLPRKIFEIFNEYATEDYGYYGKKSPGVDYEDWIDVLPSLNDRALLYCELGNEVIESRVIDAGEIQYAQLILEAIDNDVDLSQSPIHSKTKELFSKLINETDLTSSNEPEEFVAMIDHIVLEKRNDGSDDLDAWEDYEHEFKLAYEHYKKPFNKRELTDNIRRPLSTGMQTRTNESYQNSMPRTGPGIGVGIRRKVDVVDIENNFTQALSSLKSGSKKKIKSYSAVHEMNTPSGDSYYATKIVDNNDHETNIRMTKDGKDAYVVGDYDKESYKMLLDVYIRTNNITNPNDIKALNIPSEYAEEVNKLIIESVDEYLEKEPLSNIEHPTQM